MEIDRSLRAHVGISVERDALANSPSIMQAGTETAFRNRSWCAHWRTGGRCRQFCTLLLLSAGWLARPLAHADGCFVFKWNKEIDINEPTQKAIIVHDAGREDLLIQVKYEGPLEEFGWLIPVLATQG
jgi:hypothetical protein